IHPTIINTRFTGVADSERVVAANWFGGSTELKAVTLEPYYGIGYVSKDAFAENGASNLIIGTEAYPALLYVTGNLDFGTANWTLRGSMIVLGDMTSRGGPTIIYDDGFLENIPDYLFDEWPFGVSGALKIFSWKEIATAL